MQQKYQGKNVTTLRPARQGDHGFDANKRDQILIRHEDNTEKVVERSEVTES